MYHNQPNMIETHDDVIAVKDARLEAVKGKPVLLHVTYVLDPHRLYNTTPGADVRLHSTNGVNHRYLPLNSTDPNMEPSDDPLAQVNNMNYYPEDFDDGETDATRNMRRQQLYVDETTAKRRSDGVVSGNAGNANTLTGQERTAYHEHEDADAKKEAAADKKAKKEDAADKKEAAAEKKADERHGLDYGDSVKLGHNDNKG